MQVSHRTMPRELWRPHRRRGGAVAHRPRPRVPPLGCTSVAVDVVQEREESPAPAMMLPPLECPADDVTLHNPLQRLERSGTGWFGVILSHEGVLVADSHAQHCEAWVRTAADLGFPRPLGALLTRTRGLRDDAVVTRVLAWTQDAATTREVVAHKSAVYEQLMQGLRQQQQQPAEAPEARPFLEVLRRNEIPVALACAQPEAHVSAALQRADLHQHLDVVVSAEDTGAPELEWTLSHAAQRLGRPPLRCVVFCDSNVAVEAAHELGMKSVAVAGDRPLWQFAGADLVVRSLAQVTLLSLKRLFGAEELVATTRAVGDDGGEEDELDEEEGLGYGAGGGWMDDEDGPGSHRGSAQGAYFLRRR